MPLIDPKGQLQPNVKRETILEVLVQNGDTTDTSAVIINIGSTTGMLIGMTIQGTGIPVGAKILTVDSATQITMDVNATATATVSIQVSAFQIVDTEIIDLEEVYTYTGFRAVNNTLSDLILQFDNEADPMFIPAQKFILEDNFKHNKVVKLKAVTLPATAQKFILTNW